MANFIHDSVFPDIFTVSTIANMTFAVLDIRTSSYTNVCPMVGTEKYAQKYYADHCPFPPLRQNDDDVFELLEKTREKQIK